MKLVEILARELKKWPQNGCKVITQDQDRNIYFWKKEGALFDKREWSHPTGGLCDTEWYLRERTKHLASDHNTAIVTRAEWEAERAKLETYRLGIKQNMKTAKKPNKDGWIRHRGGKCPVEAGVRVEYRMRDGSTGNSVAGGERLRWTHESYPGDIMAYRLHKPAEQPVIKPAVLANVQAFNEIDSLTLNHQWAGRIERKNPLQWRDRITEIDTTVEALEEERASLVQRLDAEGFRLIGRVAHPVEDMSDWRNWRAGDLICIHDTEWSAWSDFAGKPTKIKVIDNSDVPIMVGDHKWLCPNRATWHSRPSR